MNSPHSKLLENKELILGSKSPRRRDLLHQIGLDFKVITQDVEEVWPQHLKVENIAEFLATLKASAFEGKLSADQVVICADTTVVVESEVLNKPANEEHAKQMLTLLSGKTHQVISGVCLKTKSQTLSQSCTTEVTFRDLTPEEIAHYIRFFKPFDKAGAYGIQEWIGDIGITAIKGSYNNVVGLPTHLILDMLQRIDF